MTHFPAPNSRHGIETFSNAAQFGKNLWLAATVNHEARSDRESRSVIPVRSDSEAAALAGMVIDYARTAFRLTVYREGDMLVWPNGATLTFSVMGRTPIREAQSAIGAANECNDVTIR